MSHRTTEGLLVNLQGMCEWIRNSKEVKKKLCRSYNIIISVWRNGEEAELRFKLPLQSFGAEGRS